MTAEKRLESTLRALRMNWTNEDGLQKSADEAAQNPAAVMNNPFTSESNRALLELYMDALNEIERKKTPGGSTVLSALKRFCADGNSRFSGIDRIREGEKWVLACYSRAVRLNRKPETIPEQDKENRYAAQIDAFMQNAEKNSTNETNLPSAADVKKHIADYKAKHPKSKKRRDNKCDYPYNIPGTPVWVDPEKLLDMLTLFPDARVFYRSAINAVYFKSNDPDSLCEIGILMPVRYTEESAETESA